MNRLPTLLLALGVIAPPTTWFLIQQASGAFTHFACGAARPAGAAACLLGIAVCVGAGGFAWRAIRAAREPAGTFTAGIIGGLAGIFLLANLLTLAALMVIPSCVQ